MSGADGGGGAPSAAPAGDFVPFKALGPYAHGNRWRVIEVARDGRRRTESYATKAAAEHHCDRVNAQHSMSTIDAIDAYLATLNERSRSTAKFRLYGLLRLGTRIGKPMPPGSVVDRPLATVTPAVARKLYERRTAEDVAGATLHGEVGYAQRFFAWAIERGMVEANPFADIKVTKPRSRGKPKLRVTASKQFLAHLWQDTSIESTAVLMTFVLAMRASSVVNRTVGDLDDGGRLLWIRDDKTASGDREIEIPELLRMRLLPLARNSDGTPKEPNAKLFGSASNPDPDRHWLHYHTVRLCKAAGVPRVTPHGLRGSGATNSVRMGDSLGDVARALGHADGGRTLQRHYLGGGAVESARGRQMAGLLAGAVAEHVTSDGSHEPVGQCPACGSDVPTAFRFCGACGAAQQQPEGPDAK